LNELNETGVIYWSINQRAIIINGIVAVNIWSKR